MKYVHGYSERESERLYDQSYILETLLHSGTEYPAGSSVLEVGCGVGAQSRILAHKSPGARILSIDISGEYLSAARAFIAEEGITNVEFAEVNILQTDFYDESFDHIFVCFLLEISLDTNLITN